MNRYTVSLVQSRYLRVEVNAETQEEADDKAYAAAKVEMTKPDCKWITSELEFCDPDDVKLYPISIDLTKVVSGDAPHVSKASTPNCAAKLLSCIKGVFKHGGGRHNEKAI